MQGRLRHHPLRLLISATGAQVSPSSWRLNPNLEVYSSHPLEPLQRSPAQIKRRDRDLDCLSRLGKQTPRQGAQSGMWLTSTGTGLQEATTARQGR